MALKSLDQIEYPHERIIVAQDQDSWGEAQDGLAEYGDLVGLAKVNSLADRVGVDEAVKRVAELGSLTFLDWKFHDIDDTIRRHTREATLGGASMMTVHGSAGSDALRKAIEGVDQALEADSSLKRPWVLGITVLTSIGDKGQETCESIYGANRMQKVTQFADMAADAGLDGVVCSAKEAEVLKSRPTTEHLKLVIPAIRPSYAVKPDEQKTAVTPKTAIHVGGDMLVIGRPIINAHNYDLSRQEAAMIISEEIAEAL